MFCIYFLFNKVFYFTWLVSLALEHYRGYKRFSGARNQRQYIILPQKAHTLSLSFIYAYEQHINIWAKYSVWPCKKIWCCLEKLFSPLFNLSYLPEYQWGRKRTFRRISCHPLGDCTIPHQNPSDSATGKARECDCGSGDSRHTDQTRYMLHRCTRAF